MPFGLANAPVTFQSLMNDINTLEKILVFFDNILIYSNNLQDHIEHLIIALTTLWQHKLFSKESKCIFAHQNTNDLGPIISGLGLSVDPEK